MPPSESDMALRVSGLAKSFDGKMAVRDLSLALRFGEVFCFIGANGGGKTTALRLLAGLLAPDAGGGTVLGYDLGRRFRDIRRQIGYMSQHFSLYADLTVIENLRFRADLYGLPHTRAAAEAALAQFDLVEFARRRAGQLSGGWARRLQFAAALIHAPRLLMLDEPTAGLDVLSRRDIWRRIFGLAEAGVAIIVSTHDLSEAERCSRLAFFVDGEIRAQGSPEALTLPSSAAVAGGAQASLEDLAAALLSSQPEAPPI